MIERIGYDGRRRHSVARSPQYQHPCGMHSAQPISAILLDIDESAWRAHAACNRYHL